MKTGALADKDWNDVVFENRNKDYGAYALRNSYSGNVMEGSVASIAIAVFLFFLPVIIAKINPDFPTVVYKPGVLPPLHPEPYNPVRRRTPRIPRNPTTPKVNLTPVVTKDSVADRTDLLNTSVATAIPGGTPTDVEGPIETDDNGSVANGGGTSGTGTAILENAIVDFAQFPPQYDGGMQAMARFIHNKIKYPHSAQRIGMEGTAYVRFVVNRDGSISNVEILRGFYADCDKEAARVIALMPAWKPGRQNQTAVAVRMVLPINFRIEGN